MLRELNAIALEWCRKRASPNTDYLHYCYHPSDEAVHETIPLFENFCYVYSLLQSKTVENVTLAKKILEGLLYFQNDKIQRGKGNFPIYLHEYPQCNDRLLGFHLLPLLSRILQQYHSIIGSSLAEQLRTSCRQLLDFCSSEQHEKNLPYTAALKLGASLIALSTPLEQPHQRDKGEKIIEALRMMGPTKEWYSPQDLGQILVALQLAYPSIKNSPWSSFWDHLERTYHQDLGIYAGPSLQEFQWKAAPLVTLYDFFMAYYSEKNSPSLQNKETYAPIACLVQHSHDRIDPSATPNRFEESTDSLTWNGIQKQHLAAAGFNHSLDKEDPRWKGIIPFKLLWGNRGEVHSMVAQDGCYQTLSPFINEDGAVLDYQLPSEFQFEDKEKSREIVLAIDRFPGVDISVNGSRSTTFRLGDTVAVRVGNQGFLAKFTLEEGEGQFLGHIMLGNRRSQLALKNGNRFNAYDWLIFLRTLRRGGACRIKVTINFMRDDV